MAVSTATKLHVVDSLALLALKVAPNIFDVSTGQHHASIRDQIARTQLLIRDLHRADEDFKSLLVIGGGVAGISAAFAAAHLGKKVLIVDTQPAPFALQARAQGRYVGPFMYEWPSIVSEDQSYPPNDKTLWGSFGSNTPTWVSRRPMEASKLAEQLQAWLETSRVKMGTGAPSMLFGAGREYTRGFVKRFKRAAGLNAERRLISKTAGQMPKYDVKRACTLDTPDYGIVESIVPDYVVLAAGMGIENTTLPNGPYGKKWTLKGPPFWGKDNLRSIPSSADVGVFGGGDGALQDVLRVLTKFEHPLDMLDFLNLDKDVKRAIDAELPKLSAIEAQNRLKNTWTLDRKANAEVDKLCRQVAERLARHARVIARVAKCMRIGPGKVYHFVSETYFSKTYLLNRFIIHIIKSCQASKSWKKDRMEYKLLMNCEVKWGTTHFCPSVKNYMVKATHMGTTRPYFLDEVAVRFGPVRGSASGMQMVKLSDRDSGQRSSLSHVPMTFVVP